MVVRDIDRFFAKDVIVKSLILFHKSCAMLAFVLMVVIAWDWTAPYLLSTDSQRTSSWESCKVTPGCEKTKTRIVYDAENGQFAPHVEVYTLASVSSFAAKSEVAKSFVRTYLANSEKNDTWVVRRLKSYVTCGVAK